MKCVYLLEERFGIEKEASLLCEARYTSSSPKEPKQIAEGYNNITYKYNE